MFEKFSAIVSSNILLDPFSISFLSSYNANVGVFNMSQRSLRLSLFQSIFFSVAVISTILPPRSLIPSSASFILLDSF